MRILALLVTLCLLTGGALADCCSEGQVCCETVEACCSVSQADGCCEKASQPTADRYSTEEACYQVNAQTADCCVAGAACCETREACCDQPV